MSIEALLDRYARQWFSPYAHTSFSVIHREIENLIRTRRFTEAYHCLISAGSQINKQEVKRLASRIRHISTRQEIGKSLRVAFAGFWPGFEPNNNELLNFIRHCCADLLVETEVCDYNADLLVTSCFGDPSLAHKKNPGATTLLFLGENVRPVFAFTDYSMSFDLNSYDGKNIYCPLWLLRLEPWALKNAGYNPLDSIRLSQPSAIKCKDPSICYIGNNQTPMREELILHLRRSGYKVDTFGAMTKPIRDKFSCLKRYRYSICAENSHTPGYVTEKLFESFSASTIPIYWGGLPSGLLNSASYVNLDPHEPLLNCIRDMSTFKDIATLPPLINKLDLDTFIAVRLEWLRRIIANILLL